MKPAYGDDFTSQSCSCTSCVYRSESDYPSLRRMMAQGSRIDKLYYRKYIPLRERKLLDKLVRTRAVYDDVRKQLLTESDISMKNKANLKPRKYIHSSKAIDDTERSSAISEMVDLVDMGGALESKTLTECCSCCSCYSKLQLQDYRYKGHKHIGHIARAGTYLASKSSMRSKPKRDDNTRLRRGVHFKTKHIHSDSCTCTAKFSGLIKQQSKTKFNKLQPTQITEEIPMNFKEKKSFHNMSHSRSFLFNNKEQNTESFFKKLHHSKIKKNQNYGSTAEKSRAKPKQKSFPEPDILKNKLESTESIEERNMFNIRKDSITKFKEKHNKGDSICRVCSSEDCLPEECFKIIKLRRFRKGNRLESLELETRHDKVSGITSVSDIQIQQKVNAIPTYFERKVAKKEVIERGDHVQPNNNVNQAVVIGNDKISKHKINEDVTCICEKVNSVNTSSKSKMINTITDIQKSKSESSLIGNAIEITGNKKGDKQHTGVRISCICPLKVKIKETKPKTNQPIAKEILIENYKINVNQNKADPITCICPLNVKDKGTKAETNKISVENYKISGNEIGGKQYKDKRINCICPFKVKVKGTNPEGNKSITKGISLKTQLKARPNINKIKSRHHQRRENESENASSSIFNRDFKHVTTPLHKIKHSESLALSPQKSIYGASAPQKQAVCIGSSFSFNIEFCKQKQFNNNERQTAKYPSYQIRGGTNRSEYKKIRRRHKHSQISNSTGKRKYTPTRYRLRRCLCTLKLGHRQVEKNRLKTETISAGPLRSIKTLDNNHSILPQMTSEALSTETNRFFLLPYECEKGICMEQVCNPHKCLKLINKRAGKRIKRREKQLGTKNLKTKSTNSFTSRSVVPQRNKTVQSNTITYKTEIQTGYRGNGKRDPNTIKTSSSNPSRQFVSISSSFNFDIEFFKDKRSRLLDPSIEHISKSHNAQILNNKNTGINKSSKKDDGLINTIRCLCTSKLLKKIKKAKNSKMYHNVVTETTLLDDQYKDVKINTNLKENFGAIEPYECEPYVCIPGECNPYQCLKQINYRHSKEFGTLTNQSKQKSASSTTSKISNAKGVSVESRVKRRHVYTKTRGADTDIARIKKIRQTSKQIVRVGSCFSFNIEFSKAEANVDEKRRITFPYTSKLLKKTKNKNNEPNSMNVTLTNQETQISRVNSSPDATGIKPALKRCFCTLNFQNKTNKPRNVYTISRAAVEDTKIMPHKFNCNKLQQNDFVVSDYQFQFNKMQSYFQKQYQPCFRTILINEHPSFEGWIVNSNITINKDLILDDYCTFSEACFTKTKKVMKCFYDNKKSIFKNKDKDIDRLAENFKSVSNSKTLSDVTGVVPLLRRDVCTMNIRIPDKKKYVYHKKQYKLKSYECEPGVCIPYECNPYECHKRIMKRTMVKNNKMSGTKARPRLMSSYTTQSLSNSKSKNSQFNIHNENIKPTLLRGIDYTTLPNKSKKQTVCIESAFSFNIEFSKDRATRDKQLKHSKPVKTTNRKSNGTARLKRSSSNQYAQYTTTNTENKSTNIVDKKQKCFCTLKLQKEGNQHRIIKDKLNQGTMTPPSNENEIIKKTRSFASHNTKIAKHVKLVTNLEPYECEPYTCIPGECNPYVCLERIKVRSLQSSGSNITRPKTRSAKTKTVKNKNHLKEKQIQSNIKENINSLDTKEEIIHTIARQPVIDFPSRQAVRVGSKFSFNIEFYKDKKTPFHDSKTELEINRSPLSQISFKSVDVRKIKRKELKDKAAQDLKFIHNKNAQIGLSRRAKSTMTTTFLKRCFCTSKLHRNHIIDKNKVEYLLKPITTDKTTKIIHSQNIPLLKRCLCALKLLKSKNDVNETNVRLVNFAFRKQNNKKQKVDKEVLTKRIHKLDPYECKPGICIPGACGPYMCERAIRRRQASQKTVTNKLTSKSTSSSIKPSKTFKTERTQSNFPRTSKDERYETSRRIHVEKNKVTNPASQRQAVVIDSSFSFNIEFHKNKLPSVNHVQAAAKAVKNGKHTKNKLKSRNIGAAAIRTTMNQESASKIVSADQNLQTVIPKANQSINPLLKRCFCTSKVQKRILQRAHFMNQSTEIIGDPKLHDKAIMATQKYEQYLVPYECELGVCIPGQCNPYDCLKRINKRKLKPNSTITDNYRTKSAGNVEYSDSRSKKVQFSKNKTVSPKTICSKPLQSKQSLDLFTKTTGQVVKIGSSYSIDVHFFKDRTIIDPNRPLQKKKLHDKKEIDTVDTTMKEHAAKVKNKQLQSRNFIHHRESQVLAQEIPSAMMDTGKILKRCFCTLKLQNSQNIKNDVKLKKISPTHKGTEKNKPNFDSIKRVSRNKNVYFATLHNLKPYSCECDKSIKQIENKMQMEIPGKDKIKHRIFAGLKPRSKPEPTSSQGLENKHSGFDSDSYKRFIRVGSNFSLGVEFTFGNDKKVEPPYQGNHEPKSIPKIMLTKRQKINNKNINYGDTKIQDSIVQTKRIDNQQGRFSVASFFKKYFCTLKHKKTGKPENEKPIDYNVPPNKVNENLTINNDITLKSKRNIYNLKPFKDEPYGDYKGKERPKIKDSSTETKPIKQKTVSNRTHNNINRRYAKTQTSKVKDRVNKYVKQPKNHEAVRIGSNFSFDIDFYIDRSPNFTRDISSKVPIERTKLTSKIKKDSKLKSRRTNAIDSSYSKRGLQMSCTNSKCTGTDTFLQRCFGALKLHNKSQARVKKKSKQSIVNIDNKLSVNKTPIIQNKKTAATKKKSGKSLKGKQIKVYTHDQSTSTKNKYTKSTLDHYECEINRSESRMSKTIGGHIPQIHVSSKDCNLPPYKTEVTQSKFSDKTGNKISHGQNSVVEERRIPCIFNSQIIRIGSNVRCNIEFYKENSYLSGKNDVKFTNKHSKYDNVETATQVKSKRRRKKKYSANGKSNVDAKKAAKKTSGVNNPLKRCFCTLKLPENDMHLSVKKNERVITVNRVNIDAIRKSIHDNITQHKTETELRTHSNKNDKNTDLNFNNIKNNGNFTKKAPQETKSICFELETIYPFIPNKYNKYLSNTSVFHQISNSNSINKYLHCSLDMPVGVIDKRNIIRPKKNIYKGRKRLNSDKTNESNIIRKQYLTNGIKSVSIRFKAFMWRFAQIFMRHKEKKEMQCVLLFENKLTQHLHPKLKKLQSLKSKNGEILIMSKSNRKFVDPTTLSNPKKAKSPKVIEKSRCYRYHKKNDKFTKPEGRPKALLSSCCRKCVDEDTIKYKERKIVKPMFVGDRIVQYSFLSTKNERNIQLKYRKNVSQNTARPIVREKKTLTKFNTDPSENITDIDKSTIKTGSKLKEIIICLFKKNKSDLNKECSVYCNKTRMHIPSTHQGKGDGKSALNKSLNNDEKKLTNGNDKTKLVKYLTQKGQNKAVNKKLNTEVICRQCFKKTDQTNNSVIQISKQNIESKKTEPSINNKSKKIKKRLNGIDNKILSDTLNDGTMNCPKCKKQVDFKYVHFNKQKIRSKLCTCTTPCNCNPFCTCHRCADKIKVTRISPSNFPSPKMVLLIDEVNDEMKPKGAKITIKPKKKYSFHSAMKKNLPKRSLIPVKLTPPIKKLPQKTKLPKVIQPCICGSPVCNYEAKQMQSKKLSLVQNKSKKTKKKSKNIADPFRFERYKTEDEIRRKKRKKHDKYMEAQVRKYKNTSDVLLAAESILDIGSMGFRAGIDAVRCISRAALNPKRTYEGFKSSARDPSQMLANIQNSLSNKGVTSTLKRVSARIRAMSMISGARSMLEQFPITHFMLHAADKDPQRRLQHKQRRKPVKEPVDFGCSLFMSSLRKRPCLAIYYMCPWFYPHCITFLTIWKQFTDIMLFLLAVTVWSPCILAIEICRAVMCCAFCTG